MGRHGVSPHRWHYQFIDHLAARADHVARVLCGPAAERWLAAEMYGFLADSLPEHLTCYGEDDTTDITIYETVGPNEARTAAWDRGRVASIELKLVYRWYSKDRVERYAAALCHQVLESRRHENSAMNVGFIFGVFAGWPAKRPRIRGTFATFRTEISRWVRDACDAAGAPCAKPALETIIDERDVRVGGVKMPFGLVGQYILPCAQDA